MEVIARKQQAKKGEWFLKILLLLAAEILPLIHPFLLLDINRGVIIVLFFYFVFCLVCIGLIIGLYIHYRKTPEEMILYDGRRIISSKGTFLLSEIKKIKYSLVVRRVYRYKPNEYYTHGNLYVTVGTEKITFYYVKDLVKTYNRLMELKRQAENNEERA